RRQAFQGLHRGGRRRRDRDTGRQADHGGGEVGIAGGGGARRPGRRDVAGVGAGRLQGGDHQRRRRRPSPSFRVTQPGGRYPVRHAAGGGRIVQGERKQAGARDRRAFAVGEPRQAGRRGEDEGRIAAAGEG